MPLKSQLFRGDAKLEAAAVSDPDHVTPGARGAHVAKIQTALNQLDGAGLDIDSAYGPATAAAVLAYKRKRGIINRAYQTSPDDIVGKMTMASLDQELLARENQGPLQVTVIGAKPAPEGPRPAHRPGLRLAFIFNAGFLDAAPVDTTRAGAQNVRTLSRSVPKLIFSVTRNDTKVTCVNHPPKPSDGFCRNKVCWIWDPTQPRSVVLVPEPKNEAIAPNEEDGNTLHLTTDPQTVNVDAFRPGDATITAVNSAGATRVINIQVRARPLGPVARPPLAKLEPGSSFFSASEKNGGEFDPHGVFTGRPVNPKRGGRLINLGGEMETPEFEDYQTLLGFSHFKDPFGRGFFFFRPLADDPDPAIGIAPGSASHITIRGNPVTDKHVEIIKRIAQSKCRFTFSGDIKHLATIRSKLGGTELEFAQPFADEIRIAVELP